MHTASKEWADRVAARNAVETAKGLAEHSSAIKSNEARINEALAAQGFLPLTYGTRLLPLSASGKEGK